MKRLLTLILFVGCAEQPTPQGQHVFLTDIGNTAHTGGGRLFYLEDSSLTCREVRQVVTDEWKLANALGHTGFVVQIDYDYAVDINTNEPQWTGLYGPGTTVMDHQTGQPVGYRDSRALRYQPSLGQPNRQIMQVESLRIHSSSTTTINGSVKLADETHSFDAIRCHPVEVIAINR